MTPWEEMVLNGDEKTKEGSKTKHQEGRHSGPGQEGHRPPSTKCSKGSRATGSQVPRQAGKARQVTRRSNADPALQTSPGTRYSGALADGQMGFGQGV